MVIGGPGRGGRGTDQFAPDCTFLSVLPSFYWMAPNVQVLTGFDRFFLFKLDSDKQLVTEFYWLFFDGRFLLDSDGS